jgi:hypothetical protein
MVLVFVSWSHPQVDHSAPGKNEVSEEGKSLVILSERKQMNFFSGPMCGHVHVGAIMNTTLQHCRVLITLQ